MRSISGTGVRSSASSGWNAVANQRNLEANSSINPAKREVVVKRPTEVTEIVFVNGATKYVDREGRTIAPGDLHAGDTVYIRQKRDANGVVAEEIRKGPMTLDELRKRYLKR